MNVKFLKQCGIQPHILLYLLNRSPYSLSSLYVTFSSRFLFIYLFIHVSFQLFHCLLILIVLFISSSPSFYALLFSFFPSFLLFAFFINYFFIISFPLILIVLLIYFHIFMLFFLFQFFFLLFLNISVTFFSLQFFWFIYLFNLFISITSSYFNRSFYLFPFLSCFSFFFPLFSLP